MLISDIKKEKLPKMIAEGITKLLKENNVPFRRVSCGFSKEFAHVIVTVMDEHERQHRTTSVYDRIKDFELEVSNEAVAGKFITSLLKK